MKKFSDFTEEEFKAFMKQISVANDSGTDEVLNPLLEEFERITEHPAGSDLFYYPEDGADDSDEGIIDTVKQWRASQGLPGFKKQ